MKQTFNLQRSTFNVETRQAFTLIELLVVIAIIAVLAGLAFPVFQGVIDRAKKVQAKNDVTQIVTAVNAFYTEYGKYPLTPNPPADTTYALSSATNDKLFNELRNVSASENTRGIVFLSPPQVKDSNSPRSGISGANNQYYDPWGTPYFVRLDTDYDNFVDNPYSSNAGAGKNPSGVIAVQAGAIAWSLGKDKSGGTGDKNAGNAADDVISWQ